MFRIGSLFSGIGGFELGFDGIGEVVYQAEQDKHCQKLLKEKFPNSKLFTLAEDAAKESIRIDVLVGGFPCQPHSMAGKRGGSSDERDGWPAVVRALKTQAPEWFLLENVPGLLSSENGRYFRRIIHEVGELGYGLAWRILDAQNFGVPQRRRRLFLVGRLGDLRSPAKVLFEPESLQGNFKKGKKTGEEVAGTITASFRTTKLDGNLTGYSMQGFGDYKESSKASTCKSRDWKDATDLVIGSAHPPAIAGKEVRRLTPRECERLQGFPDDYTAGQSDQQRYKQCGNAVAVPVIRWIAERIKKEAEHGIRRCN